MRPSAVTGAVLVAAVLLLVAVQDGHCAQLCMDSTFPKTINESLSFCGYNGTSCCNATDDAAVQKQFAAMNISGTPCGDIVKNILCARCNPYAGELFTVTTTPRTVPLLCSTTGVSSRLSTKPAAAAAATTTDYCSQVWDTCKDVRIPGSPFQAPKGGAAAPLLTDVWQSESEFCGALGGSGKSPCLDGEGAAFNATRPALPVNGMCLERIGNGSYLNMAAHPDGSSRVFLSNQAGKVFLATVPAQGSGKTLQLDAAAPFLDITDEVHFDNEFGLMGLAFHPDFAANGRFFVSYNCDKTKSASCAGRCACNSDVGCDPAKLSSDNGAQPCQFQTVIAEYTANATSGGTPATATSANPTEVRRIMTLGLPFTTHHGGQILFGPADGYMYFAMGDGGSGGDPWNFAQNKKSILGKIIRIDVNTMPTLLHICRWQHHCWLGKLRHPQGQPLLHRSQLCAGGLRPRLQEPMALQLRLRQALLHVLRRRWPGGVRGGRPGHQGRQLRVARVRGPPAVHAGVHPRRQHLRRRHRRHRPRHGLRAQLRQQ
ncbi:hypothetical protein PVAP13_2NG073146 [Panicum virgatum]|uniref:Glucose/Sorbosone dehydrogenase domain-containing protein n=1 Tax=Panicum virgatum TaxID=38727 RepID=A0A8T0V7D8_PANVG|nr:hypothetical protein PVAP13_2NG073146 [Panicum virgatum]